LIENGETDIVDYIVSVIEVLEHPYKIQYGLGIVSLAYPINKTDKLVQIDLIPTDNIKFTRWAYYSSGDESKYNGATRTEMLRSIAAEIEKKIINRFEVVRLSLSSQTGLSWKTETYEGKSGNILKNPEVIGRAFITKDPDKICKMLFGKTGKVSDSNSFESIWSKISSKSFPYKNKIDNIKTNAIDRFSKRNIKIPKELK
jgi:hypothetical protein